MKGKLIIGWIFFLMVSWAIPSGATHIVGGEFQFVNLNSSGDQTTLRYRVTFSIYMDCIGGDPEAIRREEIGIFFLYSNTFPRRLVDSFKIRRSGLSGIIPAGFSNNCINNPPNTCLLRNIYEFDVIVPNNNTGYYLATNNCCRNEAVMNIINPNTTGASYYVFLPALPLRNNSAKFKNFPPQIICVNNPFLYDHSATDPDGDSLSYAFGPAFNAKISTSGNQISAEATPPPYSPVSYGFLFSAQNPVGGNPPLKINPQTGLITGTPAVAGRFVVSVYCFEWRNSVIIDTIIREFQFVVTPCSRAVVANIPQYSEEFNTYIVQCRDFSVFFENLSEGGFAYFWDFGVPGTDNDTSNEFQPTFTYPDTGIYEVKLVVNRGSTCPDSITRFVRVFPTFVGDFTFSGLPCPDEPIFFRDSTLGTSAAANSWFWDFGDGDTSHVRHPQHIYEEGQEYNVMLVSRNALGCVDTVRRLVDIERFVPFAGNDTIIVKGESINFNATGGGIYTWTPATFLSDSRVGNPIGFYPDTGTFAYNVYIQSPRGCEGDDSISIRVVGQSSVFVPSAFSPNGDGKNETLRPVGVGYRNIKFFRIFNRFGQQVFYTTKFNEGWDGRFSGVPQDIGTYYWVLSITNRFGKDEILKGDSILIR
ncbi:MAG TPA: PKD domain-containing protein [Flavipsychrobacter sp.]|nr:PKD domain-containing protein [Flavipsychrobacter sp.]